MLYIYIPCANSKEAKKIGRALLDNRLVACINIWPINSLYFWPPKKSKLVEDREVVILTETKEKNLESLIDLVKKLHSYEVPAIKVWRAERGNKKYEQWLQEQIK